jgi:hypothetical protein
LRYSNYLEHLFKNYLSDTFLSVQLSRSRHNSPCGLTNCIKIINLSFLFGRATESEHTPLSWNRL